MLTVTISKKKLSLLDSMNQLSTVQLRKVKSFIAYINGTGNVKKLDQSLLEAKEGKYEQMTAKELNQWILDQ